MKSLARATCLAFALSLVLVPVAASKPRPLPSRPLAPVAPRATTIAGEDLASAIPIASLPFSESASTCGYANDGLGSACGSIAPGADVVYAHTPAADVHVEIDVCSFDYARFFLVYEDTPSSLVACGYEPCVSYSSGFVHMRAGHTYYIVVFEGQPGTCADFTLTVDAQSEPPAGQAMADAIPIPSLPFHGTGSLAGFGADYLLGECTAPGSPDRVYAFTPSSSLCVDIQMCGSEYDTSIGVFQGLNGPLIACNDDGCEADFLDSRLAAVSLLAGQTYFFVVTGFGGEFGDFVLDITPCGATSSRQITWGALRAHYR